MISFVAERLSPAVAPKMPMLGLQMKDDC